MFASAEVSLPARFGRRQGYAFITFDDAADVDKAVAEVNGKELLGREMRVQKATSGGPYPSENGEHAGESPSGETKKSRPKLRAKVLSQSLRDAFHLLTSRPRELDVRPGMQQAERRPLAQTIPQPTLPRRMPRKRTSLVADGSNPRSRNRRRTQNASKTSLSERSS
jgi:RNA recognition motif-containing protein